MATPPRYSYAVVTTGTVTDNGLPCFLSKDGNSTYPIVLFMHANKETCLRRMRTLKRLNNAVTYFDAPGMTLNDPFMSVVRITLPPKKQLTPEHLAKLADARKGKSSTVPAPTATPAKSPAAVAKK